MAEPLRVVVELTGEGQSITGTLRGPGEPHAFSGWVGLVAALASELESRQLPGGAPIAVERRGSNV